MDGSEKSYQLLGSFGAGQQLYSLNLGSDAKTHILFSAPNHYSSERPSRVKAPILGATEKHLIAHPSLSAEIERIRKENDNMQIELSEAVLL